MAACLMFDGISLLKFILPHYKILLPCWRKIPERRLIEGYWFILTLIISNIFFNSLSFQIYMTISTDNVMLDNFNNIPKAIFSYYIPSLPSTPLFLSNSKLGLANLFPFKGHWALPGESHKYANWIITNAWDSTPTVQQSIHLSFLCSLFHCLKVVIPNLYHSHQALDSLILNKWLSGGKKEN